MSETDPVYRRHTDLPHLVLGVYRVWWTESEGPGYSVAAIGQDESGRYWIAPSNWITVPTFDWSGVDRVELIEEYSYR